MKHEPFGNYLKLFLVIWWRLLVKALCNMESQIIEAYVSVLCPQSPAADNSVIKKVHKLIFSAANSQPGPDPHLNQLEVICCCKYKFGHL